MEEKKFTEKESLELISQMIQATRKNLVKGQGNYFIIYGYTAAILSIIIYTLLCMTHTPWWWAGWFLMFLPVIILAFKEKRNTPTVVTYTDSWLYHSLSEDVISRSCSRYASCTQVSGLQSRDWLSGRSACSTSRLWVSCSPYIC